MSVADHAKQQEDAFLAAAEASPLRQVRAEMRRRAQEWRSAIALRLEGGEDDYDIDLAGAVVPGDHVLALVQQPWSDGPEGEAIPVLRVLHRDGQTSIHCTIGSTGRETYLNFAGPLSPVVVRR